MTQSVLILSGGLDSTVSAWIEQEEQFSTPILALTFDYGHKAAKKEREAAAKIAARLKVPHRVLTLPWLAELTRTSLVAEEEEIPHPEENDLEDLDKGRKSAAAVWVPNRNGLFLNIAAVHAESLGAERIITGFNREEGLTFPDNSLPFVQAADEFFWYSTKNKVKVVSRTLRWDKVEIAKKAASMKIPIADLWFCYTGERTPCRRCESCQRNFRAFRTIGIADPWSVGERGSVSGTGRKE